VYPKRSSTPQKGGSENGCVGIPRCASWTVRVQSRHVDEDPRGFCDLGRSFDAEAGCSATIRARDGNRNEAATHESDAKNSCHLAVHRASSLFNNSRAITRLALFVSFCHVNILLAAAVFVHVESSADPIDPSRNPPRAPSPPRLIPSRSIAFAPLHLSCLPLRLVMFPLPACFLSFPRSRRNHSNPEAE